MLVQMQQLLLSMKSCHGPAELRDHSVATLMYRNHSKQLNYTCVTGRRRGKADLLQSAGRPSLLSIQTHRRVVGPPGCLQKKELLDLSLFVLSFLMIFTNAISLEMDLIFVLLVLVISRAKWWESLKKR